MSLTELEIRGMSCASCAAHVTRALKDVPGVRDAAVNLATERATVLHADLDPRALIAAVEGAGYEASDDLDDDKQASARRADLRRRGALLAAGAVLTAASLVLAMAVPEFPGRAWILAALALPVWGAVGFEFHAGAFAALRNRTTTMDTLVSLGSTAAIALGLYGALTGTITYFDTAAAIVTLVYAGKYLEARARVASSQSMRALLTLRPLAARRRRDDGSTEELPVDLVHAGDLLEVAAGERIPVDGVVVDGESAVDRSMLTGEAMPLDVHEGSPVEQGTLNGDGALVIRATAVGAGTELARIVEVVRRAQGTTPPVQRLADRISAMFVPAIVLVALVTFAGWLVTHHTPVAAAIAAVAVLVIACPCALGLAAPTAVIAGIGAASRRGVLFKDAGVLERTAHVTVVLFDKTGTLTTGTPTIQRVSSDDALALAAALERQSLHPLARAIVGEATARGLPIESARGVTAARGSGISGIVGELPVLAGNVAFMRAHGVVCDDDDDTVTRVWIARGGTPFGFIDLSDAVRAEAADAVARLRALGVRSELVSGDREGSVAATAAGAGIERAHGAISPEGKAELVMRLQQRGERVAFAGDGINDAPALARADAGFAMGAGSAVALETAGAAIVSNDPRAIASAVRIARATMRTIAQNLFWAFAYNAVLIPLAAFGIVQPVFAAAAMGLSSLFVVGNSLRLSGGLRAASDP